MNMELVMELMFLTMEENLMTREARKGKTGDKQAL